MHFGESRILKRPKTDAGVKRSRLESGDSPVCADGRASESEAAQRSLEPKRS
ncbi:hypothetical protein I79_008510 [Cricetulus griseus]|uniref:Uncharacterized protein n=1 Tax=Cricetulus griseus TaxID=10029 RepID=G3HDG4_CRIGR|nr:hypothetical protein I79_008510 [Cricetulus griseus]